MHGLGPGGGGEEQSGLALLQVGQICEEEAQGAAPVLQGSDVEGPGFGGAGWASHPVGTLQATRAQPQPQEWPPFSSLPTRQH